MFNFGFLSGTFMGVLTTQEILYGLLYDKKEVLISDMHKRERVNE